MSNDAKFYVSITDAEGMLQCQVTTIRSFLEQNVANEITQPYLVTLLSQLIALHRIFLDNQQQPTGKCGPTKLGELLCAAFGFLQQPTGYDGSVAIRSILTMFPEWQQLTGITLTQLRTRQKLAKALDDLHTTTPIPAPGA